MTNNELETIRSFTFEGLVLYYNTIMAPAGIKFEPHLAPVAKALLDKRIRNLMFIASPGTGKSVLLSIVWPTYLLGIDSTESILGISSGEALISDFMSAAMGIIENSPAYREIFPKVRPDKDRGWSMERGLFVTGHLDSNSDASYWGAGITSKSLTGKHGTTIILDDIHNLENSASMDQISGVVRAYNMTIMGRTDPRGARIIVAGRRWHIDDIYGQLKKRGDFVVLTLPAERPNQKILYFDLVSAQDEPNVFTDMGYEDKVPYGVDPKGQGFFWPASEQKRRDYFILKKSAPLDAKAVYQCDPLSSMDQVFSDKYLMYYTAPELLVMGGTHPSNKPFMSQFEHVLQSWDTAASSKIKSDFSVGLTAGLRPCNQWHRGEDEKVLGPADNHFDIYLMDETRVQLEPVRLLETVRIAHMKWRPSLPLLIEKKSSGEALLSILSDTGVHCEPSLSGKLSKIQRATMASGNFSIQGWFQLGRIYLPDNMMWVGDFVQELISFDGSDGCVDDRVDALIYLVKKTIELCGSVTHITGMDDDIVTSTNKPEIDVTMNNTFVPKIAIPELEALNAFTLGGIDAIFNPYAETCSTCLHYRKNSMCNKFKKKTAPIYMCDWYESSSGEGIHIMDCGSQ
jgi:phage terminase large subunit-like protein